MESVGAVRSRRNRGASGAVMLAATLVLAACGGDDQATSTTAASTTSTTADTTATEPKDTIEDPGIVVNVDGNRGLFVRCTGKGSPTVVLEGGDEDTSDSYLFAEERLARETRTCVYDRANLGLSDPAKGPRELDDLVGDLEGLLDAAHIPGPYVLVGTSGGGYITAGYAVEHPDQVAGMVFVDTGPPFQNPPNVIVKATDPKNPANVERRDYLQVEKDGWAARKPIGDIPVTVISVEYSKAEISGSPFPSERAGMATNVENQQGWLVLSPRAKQIIAHTGHAVEEDDPKLVIDAILDVVKAAG